MRVFAAENGLYFSFSGIQHSISPGKHIPSTEIAVNEPRVAIMDHHPSVFRIMCVPSRTQRVAPRLLNVGETVILTHIKSFSDSLDLIDDNKILGKILLRPAGHPKSSVTLTKVRTRSVSVRNPYPFPESKIMESVKTGAKASSEGTVRHDRNTELICGGSEPILLNIERERTVLHLNRDNLVAKPLDDLCTPEGVGVTLAESNPLDLARLDELAQRLEHNLDGDRWINSVLVMQIDVVCLQLVQGPPESFADV